MSRDDDARTAELARAELARQAAEPVLLRAVERAEDEKEAHPVARWGLFVVMVGAFLGGAALTLARAC